MCPEPLGRPLTPGAAAFQALLFVCVVGGVTVVVARSCFAAFTPSLGERVGSVATDFAGNGVWCAPLAVFVVQDRSWSVLGGALLGVATARLLGRCGCGFDDDAPDESFPGDGGMFAGLAPAGWSRRRFPAFTAAVAIQAGVFAQVIKHTAAAAVLAGIGGLLVAYFAAPVAGAPRELSSRRRRTHLAVRGACAVALATLGLIRSPGSPAAPRGPSRESAWSSPGGQVAREDLLSGAILLPNMPRHVKLVAPVPNQSARLALNRAAPPTSIEFSGEYWVFLAPLRHPPESSTVYRATPLAYTFTAVDRTPLLMLARQRLGSPVDSRCCSSIDLAVQNADRQPEAISLEVSLATSGPPRAPHQRLGPRDLPPVESAVLSFPMPARPVIPRFDEIIVEFQLHSPRMYRSANVSIQRFVLVPRGR